MKITNHKKLTSIIITLVMTISIISPFGVVSASAADAKTYDLIEVTDFHGALESSSNQPVAGVLAKDIKDIKAANQSRTLIMGGGDLYQGSALSNIPHGLPVQKVMSNIGMEVTALGNHEFDWGLDEIVNNTMKDAKYSIVCSNLYDKTTNKRKFEPYKIIEKDGVKIGVIGAITTETPSIVLPAYVANYTFTDPVTEINSLVPEVKAAGANVVVAVIHEGTNVPDTKTGKIYDIANKLTGVDAVFGGHSHTIAYYRAANGVPVYVGNNAGKGFIDAKMTIGADGKASFVCDSSSYVGIDTNAANGYKAATPAVDPEVTALVNQAKTDVGPTLNDKIGTDDKAFTRNQTKGLYSDSELGNWVTDVMKAKVKADVAFQNVGGIRTDLDAGSINVGTIYTIMPFDNVICTVDMTKAQIKYVLEQAFADNGKGIQLSGLKVTYDPSRKSMDRVVDIQRADGKPIVDGDKLKVATNDFVMTGGDGFTGFVDAGGSVKGTPVNNTQILVRDALIDDVRANKTIKAYVDGRITTGKAINIVATSDLHGSLMPFDYSSMKAADLGLAKVSTYVNNLRESSKQRVMLIDNGDTIQGTPLAYYYDIINQKAEYPMMKAMGAMHYDSWTLGNHEFNFGLDVLKRIIKDATKEKIPVLSANTYKDDNTNFVKPYIIKKYPINGKIIKIGVLGLTTKTIPSWEDPAHYAGLHFNDLVAEAKKGVKELKDNGCNVIIASIHSGISSPSDTIPENQVDAVATQVSGIDAIACGHTHVAIGERDFTNPDGKKVVVTEPKNTDKIFSQIDIVVDNDGNIKNIASKNVTLDASIPADPKIVAIGQYYQDRTLDYVNTVIGSASDEYSGKDQTVKPTALMDLINTVQMKAAGTQLSIAAPLSASAYIPKGDVKLKDLMGVYVYENFLFGIKMNGKQIKAWLEYSNRYYKQVTKADDPIIKDPVLNVPDYNLDQLYGATYDIDLTQPVGSRIKNLKYNGKLIQDTDEFTVAINNYRFNGGGGFLDAAGLKSGDQSIVTYDSAKKLGDDGQVRSLMVQYIKDNKTITPTVANNWKISTTPVAEEK